MKKFTTLTSLPVILTADDVDTDQIIPSRFLKRTSSTGFADALFHDLRYDAQGNEIANFPLNKAKGTEQILAAGKNFGCGSSREHAVWAIRDAGFRVIIAESFADIFKNNALQNGILPVTVTNSFLEKIRQTPAPGITVDLLQQTIKIESAELTESFTIDSYHRQCLLDGFQETDFLIAHRSVIAAFEKEHRFNYSL
ncbi:MAG: 3-isopropylmalate dehydratase small subunit [Bacteroidetes bacterium]|nr:3-isopropylmalate dehydratase small subunit [Bacteroidota bacterium]